MRTCSKLPIIRDPETLRSYARILRLPVRIPLPKGGSYVAGATIINWTAAEALEYAADEIEIQRDEQLEDRK